MVDDLSDLLHKPSFIDTAAVFFGVALMSLYVFVSGVGYILL